MSEYPVVPQRDKPFDLATANMVSRELADGVWAVMADDVDDADHAATNGGFVVGEESVLVVETLSNERLCHQLLDAVRRQTDLPVRFAVNTSHHGDHCFGNYALDRTTSVIAHQATREELVAGFADELRHMREFMGEGNGLESVRLRLPDVGILGPVRIGLGGLDVEVRPIGLIQTPGDVAVHIPDRGVIFVGNAVNGPPPALPWVGDADIPVVIESYRRLRDSLAPDTVIVTGHGRTMRPADIDFSVQYLERLARAIGEARAAGAGPEDVLADPAFASYSAYSLFDVAHGRVNVPGAFASAARAAG